jgi:hypothetical protein
MVIAWMIMRRELRGSLRASGLAHTFLAAACGRRRDLAFSRAARVRVGAAGRTSRQLALCSAAGIRGVRVALFLQLQQRRRFQRMYGSIPRSRLPAAFLVKPHPNRKDKRYECPGASAVHRSRGNERTPSSTTRLPQTLPPVYFVKHVALVLSTRFISVIEQFEKTLLFGLDASVDLEYIM